MHLIISCLGLVLKGNRRRFLLPSVILLYCFTLVVDGFTVYNDGIYAHIGVAVLMRYEKGCRMKELYHRNPQICIYLHKQLA